MDRELGCREARNTRPDKEAKPLTAKYASYKLEHTLKKSELVFGFQRVLQNKGGTRAPNTAGSAQVKSASGTPNPACAHEGECFWRNDLREI